MTNNQFQLHIVPLLISLWGDRQINDNVIAVWCQKLHRWAVRDVENAIREIYARYSKLLPAVYKVRQLLSETPFEPAERGDAFIDDPILHEFACACRGSHSRDKTWTYGTPDAEIGRAADQRAQAQRIRECTDMKHRGVLTSKDEYYYSIMRKMFVHIWNGQAMPLPHRARASVAKRFGQEIADSYKYWPPADDDRPIETKTEPLPMQTIGQAVLDNDPGYTDDVPF